MATALAERDEQWRVPFAENERLVSDQRNMLADMQAEVEVPCSLLDPLLIAHSPLPHSVEPIPLPSPPFDPPSLQSDSCRGCRLRSWHRSRRWTLLC